MLFFEKYKKHGLSHKKKPPKLESLSLVATKVI